jgi:hypothetical protein
MLDVCFYLFVLALFCIYSIKFSEKNSLNIIEDECFAFLNHVDERIKLKTLFEDLSFLSIKTLAKLKPFTEFSPEELYGNTNFWDIINEELKKKIKKVCDNELQNALLNPELRNFIKVFFFFFNYYLQFRI